MMQDQAGRAWGEVVAEWQTLSVGRDSGGHLIQLLSQSKVPGLAGLACGHSGSSCTLIAYWTTKQPFLFAGQLWLLKNTSS